MGIVYAAYDDELDRKVAIKLVRATKIDELARARVLREAQAMARVSHPNVVQIYDVGVHGEEVEQVYVAMEFVAGPTLAEWTASWRERARLEGALVWPEILARYVDAGRGLAAAHAAGLVHRDFKPANAIVGDDGRVRVLDFGIARPILGALPRASQLQPVAEVALGLVSATGAPSNQSSTFTRTGAMVGTPAYMSPEQFEGGDVDASSDQFGFCVALWEALHGERPFAGRSPAALLLAMREGALRAVPPTSQVPAWLRERIRRGLSFDPAARWPSMDALLQALLDDPDRRRRARQRRLGIALISLAVLGGSLAFAHDQWISAEQAEHARAQALEEEAAARQRELEAQAERDRALDEARANALRARDIARILAASSVIRDPTLAAAMLGEVEDLDAPGWRSAALELLQQPIARHVLDMHEDRVVDVAFSPEGKWLASASFDGRVRLWSTDAIGSDRYYALHHDDRVFDVEFDPSGRRLVSSSRDFTARVWTLPEAPPSRAAEPLEPSQVLRGHESIIWTARFSSTGDRVVTASRDKGVWVWTLGEDREPSPSQRLELDVIAWHAEFSPDDREVVIALDDGRVLAWELERDQTRVLARHRDVAWIAHYSPDGRWVASASKSGEVRLDPVVPLDVTAASGGGLLGVHEGSVQRLSFAPDGRTLASASHDGTARVWTFDEQDRLASVRTIETNKFALTPAFSPDGRWLAIGSVDPVVRVVELAGGLPIELRGHTSDVFALAFSPDGTRLVTGSHDRSVRVWSTDWSQVARRFTSSVAPDAGGRWLVERRDDGRLRFWRIGPEGITPQGLTKDPVGTDTTLGAWLRTEDADVVVLPNEAGDLVGIVLEDSEGDRALEVRWRLPGIGPLFSLSVSPEGHWLVAGARTDEAALWYFAAPGGVREAPRRVDLREGMFERGLGWLGIAPDGRTLVTTTIWGQVRITALDPGTGEVGESHLVDSKGAGRTNALLFDPEGQWFALNSIERNIRVWRVGQPEQPAMTVTLASEARTLVHDPRSGRILLGCADGMVRSFDPETGDVELLEGLEGTPVGLELASREPWLMLGSAEGDLMLRDGEGEPIQLVIEAGFRQLDFAGEDHFVIVSGPLQDLQSEVLVLGERIDAASLLARLRASTDACPSADERIRYAGEAPESAARGCE